MGELEDKINSLLKDPEELGKLTRLAQSVMGSFGQSGPEEAPKAAEPGLLDPGMISAISSAMSKSGGGKKESDLLRAMRPYLAEKRRDKVDKAVKIAQLARLAQLALAEYGGGSGGE